jgi:hypothetical protein
MLERLECTKPEDIERRDVYDVLPSVSPFKWTRGRVVLMGDAIHAVQPNLGQGGGQVNSLLLEKTDATDVKRDAIDVKTDVIDVKIDLVIVSTSHCGWCKCLNPRRGTHEQLHHGVKINKNKIIDASAYFCPGGGSQFEG